MKNDELVKLAYPNRPWFAVKCVYHDSKKGLYEERITLYRARDGKEAIDKAEEETKQVCEALEGYSYTGYAEAFHLFDEEFNDGVELYASLRKSKLSSADYVKKFVRTGEEIGFEK
jgi:lauroyl/myristoyl acyltransferase